MQRACLFLAILIFLISCGAGQIGLASAAGQRLRVGLFDNKPMCYREDGKAAGIFVVVLEYVAQQEGWLLEYVDGDWGELRHKLERGEIDILPSMALSAERQQIYAFNNLDVFTNWGEIYVPPGAKIHNFFDLQGKRLATVDQAIYTTGPEGIIKLDEVFGLKSKIVLVPGFVEAMEAVQHGQADVAVVNRLIGALYAESKGLKKSGIVFCPVKIRFGLSKQNLQTPALIAAIDRHLQVLRDDDDSPYHQVLGQVFTDQQQVYELSSWLHYGLLAIVGLVVLLVFFVYALRRQVALKTKAFLDSEERFLDIAENCLDWVWEFDEQARFTYASKRVKDLLGYSPEELLGKSAFDLIPSPEKEKVAAEFNMLKDKRQPFALLENVNQHKDGHLVTLESSGVPIVDENGVFRGYRGIDRDVSERKAIEEKLRQAQKMEAIGTLAGGIAHDFNNILSAIFGYAELAQMQLAEKLDIDDELAQILHAARRARELVKQILTFSRQSKQEKQVVPLALIVKESLKLLRPSIPSTITIEEDISSSALISADLTQIQQVIMNLCTNAYHAMEETGGTLTIGLSDKSFDVPHYFLGHMLDAGQYVVLEVCDTGKGIAKDNISKIFEPYFTTKDTGRGTGLGLAVVHGVVHSHHGAIDVASEPGQGACFFVYLPVFQEGAQPGAAGNDSGEVSAGHGERILVVDDEEGVRSVVARMLENGGYQVDCCANGQEALDLLAAQQGRYDLLLTDMTMPVMTGKELAVQAAGRYPALPVVLCTGYSTLISQEEAAALGIKAYLPKPLTRSELLAQLRQTLDECRETAGAG